MKAGDPTATDPSRDPVAASTGALTAAELAGERAIRNTAARAAAEVLGKLSTIVLLGALARATGQAGLGAFIFAFAFLQIALTPVTLGFDVYLLREVARRRASFAALFFNVLSLKALIAVPVVAVTLGAVFVLDYGAQTRATIAVLAAGVLLELLAKTIESAFNAHERSELLAVSLVVQRVVTAALGLAALGAGYGVVTVAALYTLGTALYASLALALLHRAVGLPRWSIQPRGWRALTTSSLPFAVQDVFIVLLFKLDVVLLSLIASGAAVGRYGACYRLMETTLFVSWAVLGAFSAMYAYLGYDTQPTIGAVFQRSLKLALAALVPIAVVVAMRAEPLVRLVYGADFASAADVLRILAPVIVLLSVATLSITLLISRTDPRATVRISGAMVLLNLVANLVLIPGHADVGAAAAMLLTELVFVGVVLRRAVRAVRGIDWRMTLASPALAGALMALALLALPGGLAGPSLLAAALYLVALGVLERTISPADFAFVSAAVRRRLRRPRPAGQP